jgi:hypothetical protein
MEVRGMSRIIHVARMRRSAPLDDSGDSRRLTPWGRVQAGPLLIACLRWWLEMNLGQLQLIEADILIIVEGVGKDATVSDLRQQLLDIEAVIGGATGREKVDGGGEEIPGAEDVALPQMITSGGELHEPMEELAITPGFVGDQLLEIVMASQKGAAIEEVDPLPQIFSAHGLDRARVCHS